MLSRCGTHPDLLALLRTISKGYEFPPLSSFNERQIRWVIETGLAPLFCFASRKDLGREAVRSWGDLKTSDLTIRLINEIQLETLNEILIKCRKLLAPITLLKGCSIGEFYPEPHLRVMRDLDLLVDLKEQSVVESILLEMGFRQQSTNSEEYYATHHHSMPFYHGGNDVWVEVHRRLFPPGYKLAALPVFSPANIAAESKLFWLKDVRVLRLSVELQMVYTACHWALELKREGGLFALLDIIHLLRTAHQAIRWNVIFNWIKGSVAGTHLYLALSYLDQNNIVDFDRDILRELCCHQRSFGVVNLKIAHNLITRYVVAGKMPIAPGKLAMLWENLLLDQGPARNLVSFCKKMLSAHS
jgi:Uncharacterised nucleotidyltransferase